MKKKHILFSIVTIVIFLSCERQLNVDLSKEKPLIAMHGVVEPDKPIEVAVSKSFSFLDTDTMAPYLHDASVNLHINGKFVEEMNLTSVDNSSHSARRGRSLFRSSAHAKIGDRVRFEASAPNMKSVWAETVIPAPPTIGKVDTTTFFTMIDTNNLYVYYGYRLYDDIPEISREPFLRMLRLHIDVQRADNNNPQYFQLNLSAVVPSEQSLNNFSRHELYINTQEDPVFANDPRSSIFDAVFEKNNAFSGSPLFQDHAFKNNLYTLNVSTYGYYDINIEYEENKEGVPAKYKSHTVNNLPIEIKVSSLAPDWYAYLKLREQRVYKDDVTFISEPKVTLSNVHNGIGFIGSMSYATKRIKTPPFTGKKNEGPR